MCGGHSPANTRQAAAIQNLLWSSLATSSLWDVTSLRWAVTSLRWNVSGIWRVKDQESGLCYVKSLNWWMTSSLTFYRYLKRYVILKIRMDISLNYTTSKYYILIFQTLHNNLILVCQTSNLLSMKLSMNYFEFHVEDILITYLSVSIKKGNGWKFNHKLYIIFILLERCNMRWWS